MRTGLALALGLLLCAPARADEVRVSVPAWMLREDMSATQHAGLVRTADREIERGRGTAIAGIVLSVLGTVMTVAGPLVLATSFDCSSGCNDRYSGAVAMSTLGPIMFVAGIPTWVAGEAQLQRAKRSRVTVIANGIRF